MNTSQPTTINVAIVDDSELVRAGLRALLSTDLTLRIVGEASTVKTAIELVSLKPPDVILVDIRLPDGTGFDVCAKVREISSTTRILFLTSVMEDGFVKEAIRVGGSGYLLKEIDGHALIHAIADVAAGKSILDPHIAARVMTMMRDRDNVAPLTSLSPQERRVIALIARGKTNKEAAAELNLSEKTVKNYLSNAYEKLNVTRRSHAAALFAQTSLDEI